MYLDEKKNKKQAVNLYCKIFNQNKEFRPIITRVRNKTKELFFKTNIQYIFYF